TARGLLVELVGALFEQRLLGAQRRRSVQMNASIAAMVSSGALRFGQCPVAFMTTNLLSGSAPFKYSPTASGAITSCEHCKIRQGVLTRARSLRLSDRNVTRAKSLAIAGSVRQKLLASSRPSSGRSWLPMITGAMLADHPR